MKGYYPDWDISIPLVRIFEDIVRGWRGRADER
jgi:hypothetical protein